MTTLTGWYVSVTGYALFHWSKGGGGRIFGVTDGLSEYVIWQYYQINMTFNYILQTKRTDVPSQSEADTQTRRPALHPKLPKLPVKGMVRPAPPLPADDNVKTRQDLFKNRGGYITISKRPKTHYSILTSHPHCPCTNQTPCWEHVMNSVPFKFGPKLQVWNNDVMSIHSKDLVDYPPIKRSLDLDAFVYDSSMERSVISST